MNTPPSEAQARVAARRGSVILTPGDPAFPIPPGTPQAPAGLFLEGNPEVLQAPKVAVIGTRAASVHGLADAWELGAFLGAAGISVVSGLAIGTDVRPPPISLKTRLADCRRREYGSRSLRSYLV